MPSMRFDLVEIKDNKLVAKRSIKKDTNLGPFFMKTKVKIIPTQLGKVVKQDSIFFNTIIKHQRWKYYGVTIDNISKGGEIIIRNYPWQEI